VGEEREMSSSYEQRLKAAAKIILSSDSSPSDDEPPLFSPEEIGIMATLKPHQLEGVSWLIRRYLLGVNVILGTSLALSPPLLFSVYTFYHLPSYSKSDLNFGIFLCSR